MDALFQEAPWQQCVISVQSIKLLMQSEGGYDRAGFSHLFTKEQDHRAWNPFRGR